MNNAMESDELARVRTFIAEHEWHFAKTMPLIPHWYCLKRDKMNTGDEGAAEREAEEFLWFAGAGDVNLPR